MAVDFTCAPDRRYRDYLTSHNVRQTFDVVLSKPIRQTIGSIEDIFKRDTSASLTQSLRDFIWFRAGPNENVEVIRVNLFAVCAELDARDADSVTAFQSLFVKADGREAAIGSPGMLHDPSAREGDPYGKAVALTRQQRYAPALKALVDGGSDWRCHYLRGVLLRGIAGQPKSAEIVDLAAAEAAFLVAFERVNDPSEAARARVEAGKAAYASGERAAAKAHFRAALALDSRSGEAHYQLARLAMQTKDAGIVRQHLPQALDRHWSYGIRAASDPLLASGPALVVQCVRGATGDMSREVERSFSYADTGLKFLRAQQGKDRPIGALAAYKPLTSEMKHVGAALPTRLLKRAFDLRRKTGALHQGMEKLAMDYCAVLRGTETMAGQRYRAGRNPADIARSLTRHAGPWLNAIAKERTLAGAKTAVRELVAQREQRRNENRLHRIERRFGLVAE